MNNNDKQGKRIKKDEAATSSFVGINYRSSHFNSKYFVSHLTLMHSFPTLHGQEEERLVQLGEKGNGESRGSDVQAKP